ncbi:hypothetical protein ACTU45_03430 [Streptomyces sp. 24-1644]|uniref:hypothetical protein n=1 Tax=Streptomyces sp. 24-1644 TaxID=3457315 RepID=UPI003FA737E6
MRRDDDRHRAAHRPGALPRRPPRGSWPADDYAAAQRAQGIDAHVVMDLTTDQFLVVTGTTTR